MTTWQRAFPWALAAVTLAGYVELRVELNRERAELAVVKLRTRELEAWRDRHEARGLALAKHHESKLGELRNELGHLQGFADRLAADVARGKR